MRIIPVTHSSFPRIGEKPEEQKLRRAFASLEEGKITQSEFEQIQDDAVDEVVGIQEAAGIELITDGMIRWYDPASHLAKNLKGFEINGLLRFFDTNFYYRQPVAVDVIAERNGDLAGEIEYAAAKSRKQIKAVMLGPLSLSMMALNKSTLKFEDFCLRLGEVLGREVASLAATGASVIQIEEPCLVRNPEHFELFKASFAKLIRHKQNSKLALTFYFGDAGKVIDRLYEIPADIFGIDFTYSPGLLDKISIDGFPKPLAFGVLDGRNTRLESGDEIAKKLEKVLKKLNGREHHITTSCGLEFLPKKHAIKKLELTAQVAKMLNG
jgi:5-methyltetrahydropteroyltriglutamate--homocysteine methyltransferase